MPTPDDLRNRRGLASGRFAAIILAAALSLGLWACTPAFGETEACPNAQIRAEQPYGQQLPDCRAYELVSPLDTNGQDATLAAAEGQPHASLSGEAVTYASRGLFGEPQGGNVENQYVSRREPAGWSTQTVSPLQDPRETGSAFPFRGNIFTPELTKAVTDTNAPLVEGAPGGKALNEFGLYVADFATRSYQFVAPGLFSFGASTDLSRVMLERSEWIDGTTVPVTVTNEGEAMSGTPGASPKDDGSVTGEVKDLWHAVSSDGTRVYFTVPSALTRPGVEELFLRENVGEPQSPIAEAEASGTGTLTAGSDVVSSLVVAAGLVAGQVERGASQIEVTTTVGKFVVGQPLTGPGIAVGTTVTAVAGNKLTLSLPMASKVEAGSGVSSEGPAPFTLGQGVSGDGVPAGTTITALAPGSLTLSHPAASSGTGVAMNAGGGCTVAADACTIDVSASQRSKPNPAGRQPARYWGASADGSRVFFTTTADLTEDAYTGPSGNAPNLYEYRLSSDPGVAGRLTDLSVTERGNGAAVLGVTQISEDGSYVYFVAEGELASGATAGKPNLYVSHEGNVRLVTTLAAGDQSDWDGGSSLPETEAGPEVNTAVVNPSGTSMAFLSTASLTGYDNQEAHPGDCEGVAGRCAEVFLYSAETDRVVCASCDPSGARPVSSAGFGRSLVEPNSLYRSRNLLEDGVLFFESSDPLVAGATNGHENVFEYEDGRAYPLSDVTGGYESFFLDASPSGRDVFIGTADELLEGQATGNNIVVYDARADGGFPASVAPASCTTGEGCLREKAPPSAVGSPATATFSGPGNVTPVPAPPVVKSKSAAEVRAVRLATALRACRKDKARKKRLSCERAARRRYGAVKARTRRGTASSKGTGVRVGIEGRMGR